MSLLNILQARTHSEVEANSTQSRIRKKRRILNPKITKAALFFAALTVLVFLSAWLPTRVGSNVSASGNQFNPGCTDIGNDPVERLFALDFTLGKFTYTQAKVIDATWDVIIGQGGRLLHGWILYRYVLHPLLVFAMETSTVTYGYYTAVSFSRASLETLWITLSTLLSQKSFTVLFVNALLPFLLGYTLVFPVLWGTATGYLSLSHWLFKMPGGDLVPLQSPELALCWALDSARLGLTPGHVEVGPSFVSLTPSAHHSPYEKHQTCITKQPYETYKLRYTSGGWSPVGVDTIWDHFDYNDSIASSSENFRNIRAYALAAQMLQITLNSHGSVTAEAAAGLKSHLKLNALGGFRAPWWLNQTDCMLQPLDSPTSSVDIPVSIAPGEGLVSNSSPDNVVAFPPYNETGFEKNKWYRFAYNESVYKEGQSLIPYNSTLWLNGHPYELPAPFLDVGYKCTANRAWGSLGNCVCYKGSPISLDSLGHDNAICSTAPGFVWGFSSNLVRVGLILETAWITCCLVGHTWLFRRSRFLTQSLIKMPSSIRSMLDCSQSVLNDLGPDAQRLSEKEIVQRLKGFKITYQAYEDSQTAEDPPIEEEGDIAKQSHHSANADTLRFRITSREDELPVSDALNRRLDDSMKSIKLYARAGKVRPSENDVYEDLNWRIYR